MPTPNMPNKGYELHRAVVQSADPVTGITQVKIPDLLGKQVVDVHWAGLEQVGGVFKTPNVGDMSLVAVSNDGTQIMWVLSADHSALWNSIQALVEQVVPAGTIHPTISATADPGYLLLDGSAVASAQTLYPSLWAKSPAGWKSGSTLTLPDARGRVLVGKNGGTFLNIGDLGGVESVTLTSAQSGLPAHNHTQNAHTHVQDAHTHIQNAHTHTQDSHNHTQNAHTHTQNAHSHSVYQDATPNSMMYITIAAGTSYNAYVLSGTAGASNIQPVATNTTATNQNTTATNIATTATNQNTTATNQNTTATNQNTTATNNANTAADAASAHTNLQPYLVTNYQIKAH